MNNHLKTSITNDILTSFNKFIISLHNSYLFFALSSLYPRISLFLFPSILALSFSLHWFCFHSVSCVAISFWCSLYLYLSGHFDRFVSFFICLCFTPYQRLLDFSRSLTFVYLLLRLPFFTQSISCIKKRHTHQLWSLRWNVDSVWKKDESATPFKLLL